MLCMRILPNLPSLEIGFLLSKWTILFPALYARAT